jgi:hypothetical protein
LFYRADIAFEYGDWKCSADRQVTNWFKKKPGSTTGEWMQHRDDDLPAQIEVMDAGGVQLYWYRNGMQHRAGNKPSVVSPLMQTWRIDGKLHRSDGGPGLITIDGSIDWTYEVEDAVGIFIQERPDHAYNCPFYSGQEEMLAWQKRETSLVRWYNGPVHPPGGPSLA